MTLTPLETLAVIAACVLGTVTTRFLPFLLFPEGKARPAFVAFLGQSLPYAAVGLLVVYCLRNLSFFAPAGWLPEAVALLFTVLLHLWRGRTLLSIGAGTAVYMLLVQLVR